MANLELLDATSRDSLNSCSLCNSCFLITVHPSATMASYPDQQFIRTGNLDISRSYWWNSFLKLFTIELNLYPYKYFLLDYKFLIWNKRFKSCVIASGLYYTYYSLRQSLSSQIGICKENVWYVRQYYHTIENRSNQGYKNCFSMFVTLVPVLLRLHAIISIINIHYNVTTRFVHGCEIGPRPGLLFSHVYSSQPQRKRPTFWTLSFVDTPYRCIVVQTPQSKVIESLQFEWCIQPEFHIKYAWVSNHTIYGHFCQLLFIIDNKNIFMDMIFKPIPRTYIAGKSTLGRIMDWCLMSPAGSWMNLIIFIVFRDSV